RLGRRQGNCTFGFSCSSEQTGNAPINGIAISVNITSANLSRISGYLKGDNLIIQPQVSYEQG
ncbi:MAG: hypothetical protein K2J78_07175, partial [Muribaculaceae bacterium]|nr:hypothetical protein [Muribaculaceae bacterium]